MKIFIPPMDKDKYDKFIAEVLIFIAIRLCSDNNSKLDFKKLINNYEGSVE